MAINKTNGAVATKSPEVAETAPAPVSRKLNTDTPANNGERVSNYGDAKDRRILVQGITQAVAASPVVAGLSYTNEREGVELIKRVARELIAFVDADGK